MKVFRAALSVVLLGAFNTVASAASVSLVPASQSVMVGESLTVLVNFDFRGDPTLGGGVDVFYDPAVLEFSAFAFGTGAGLDPGYNRKPDEKKGAGDRALGELDALGFGNFAGLTGPGAVGELSFLAIGPGKVTLELAVNDSVAGGFYSAGSYNPQQVIFVGAEVQVSAVPLPAAGWLVLSALGALGLRARRRRGSE